MPKNGKDRDAKILETLESIDRVVVANAKTLELMKKTGVTTRDTVAELLREVRSRFTETFVLIREFLKKR